MLSWRMGRTPPAHLTTDEEKKAWQTTADIARFWVMTVAIKKSRISSNRLKVRTHTSRLSLSLSLTLSLEACH